MRLVFAIALTFVVVVFVSQRSEREPGAAPPAEAVRAERTVQLDPATVAPAPPAARPPRPKAPPPASPPSPPAAQEVAVEDEVVEEIEVVASAPFVETPLGDGAATSETDAEPAPISGPPMNPEASAGLVRRMLSVYERMGERG